MLFVSTFLKSKIFFLVLTAKSLCQAIAVSSTGTSSSSVPCLTPFFCREIKRHQTQGLKRDFKMLPEKAAILICKMTLQRKEALFLQYLSMFVGGQHCPWKYFCILVVGRCLCSPDKFVNASEELGFPSQSCFHWLWLPLS